MAKVTAPLLSLGGRGTIGKTIVFAKTIGIPYARQWVKPANPQTTAQQANRARFAFWREMWKRAPTLVQLPWAAYAAGRPFYGMNAFVGENIRLVGVAVDAQDSEMSPGAKGGIPPASVAVATGGAPGELDITITAEASLPSGWTITRSIAVAIHDVDTNSIFDGVIVADDDAGANPTITLTGLGSGTNCVGYGFIEYEKPDGSLAYSVSVNGVDTAGV